MAISTQPFTFGGYSIPANRLVIVAPIHTHYQADLWDNPEDFDPEHAYPALLALPPGPQTERMVEAGLGRYWGDLAAERGWIVVSPVAPGGVTFFQGSEHLVPELLAQVRDEHRVENGRFHLAGASNGGRSAFRVALEYPEEFLSLTVLPGFPPNDEDRRRLERIAGMPVRMAARRVPLLLAWPGS